MSRRSERVWGVWGSFAGSGFYIDDGSFSLSDEAAYLSIL